MCRWPSIPLIQGLNHYVLAQGAKLPVSHDARVETLKKTILYVTATALLSIDDLESKSTPLNNIAGTLSWCASFELLITNLLIVLTPRLCSHKDVKWLANTIIAT